MNMKLIKKSAVLSICLLVLFWGIMENDKKAHASSMKISRSSISLYVGDKTKVKLKNIPKALKGRKIIWGSSKKSVARVSNSGKITACSTGITKIKATVGINYCKCTVIVKNKPTPTYSFKISAWNDHTLSLKFNKAVSIRPDQFQVSIKRFASSKYGVSLNIAGVTKKNQKKYILSVGNTQDGYNFIPGSGINKGYYVCVTVNNLSKKQQSLSEETLY